MILRRADESDIDAIAGMEKICFPLTTARASIMSSCTGFPSSTRDWASLLMASLWLASTVLKDATPGRKLFLPPVYPAK